MIDLGVFVDKYVSFIVVWILIGFSADLDPDPAFYLNVGPDPDPMRIHAKPF
jgi:hypothetical protein